MIHKLEPGSQKELGHDITLFLSLAALVVTVCSLVFIFANLGDLRTIIFMKYMDHSLVSATCTVVGVLGMFCLCCGLAKVVFRSGYKQFSKKGF